MNNNCAFANDYHTLIAELGYNFKDISLLRNALTHSSYIKEGRESYHKNNERLEFLGDAFFDAIVSEELYKRLGHSEEGRLTKLRAQIVCERSLADVAKGFDIGNYMLMGKGEEHTGGRTRVSILADAMEAIIGAVFMDGGYEAAKALVLSAFRETIENAIAGRGFADYKTALQEKLQAVGREHTKICYVLDREEGPDHNKTFYVNLVCNDKILGKGKGGTKKEAEQNAAKQALERGDAFVF